MKDDKKISHIAPAPAAQPMPQTGCVVCGNYEGQFTGAAGHARWHAECEGARPDVIAKVRARA